MKKQLSREKMSALMKAHCNGNYNLFGRELGVDAGHLYRFLNTGVGGGKKVMLGLMDYCIKNKLDYHAFFDE